MIEAAHFIAFVGKETPLKYYRPVQFVCNLIALELQKTTFYQHNESALENQFMKGLIEGTLSETEQKTFAKKLNWKEEATRRVLLLSGQDGSLDLGTARWAVQRISEYLSEIHTVSYHGYYVVLCGIKNQNLWEEMTKVLKRYHMICSVSSEFSQLPLAAQSYGQAVSGKERLHILLTIEFFKIRFSK